MRYVIMRLQAPLMAAGTVAVDTHRVTDTLPSQSLLTGLLANALGYHYLDPRHSQLQDSIQYAARADRDGKRLIDYQTASISVTDDMMWTTTGLAVKRSGKRDKSAIHIRHKHYVSDAVWTIALHSDFVNEGNIERALCRPARPLFIGRKCCVPCARIYHSTVKANDVLAALKAVPAYERTNQRLRAIWPAAIDHGDDSRIERVADLRDWTQAVFFGGTRTVRRGLITVQGAAQ